MSLRPAADLGETENEAADEAETAVEIEFEAEIETETDREIDETEAWLSESFDHLTQHLCSLHRIASQWYGRLES